MKPAAAPDETVSVCVFLDFEFYTEKEHREEGQGFDYNPHHPNNLFLGGVIKRVWPDKAEDPLFQSWIWDEDGDERSVVSKIYQHLKETGELVKEKYGDTANVILCGFGVASMDIPVLYSKCLQHDVPEGDRAELFKTLFGSKKFEVGCIIPAYLNKMEIPYLYARSMNVAKKRFMAKDADLRFKDAGTVVFDYYEAGDHRSIVERTVGEVEDCHTLHDRIVAYINNGVRNYQNRSQNKGR